MTDWNLEDLECELSPHSSSRLVCQQGAEVIQQLLVKLALGPLSQPNTVVNAALGKPCCRNNRGPL
jgi:hypothetical protein